MVPTGGPTPSAAFSRASSRSPRRRTRSRKTLAIIAADADFPHTPPTAPARTPRKPGFEIVYDKTYPPATTDFTPIVRRCSRQRRCRVQRSYPPKLRSAWCTAANEIGLNAENVRRRAGRPAIRPRSRSSSGPAQRHRDYDFWEPSQDLKLPGVDDFLKKYQATRAGRRRRPARLLSRRLGLFTSSGAGGSSGRSQEPQRR